MIVALNKSDLLSKSELGAAEDNARDKLTFLPYVPIVRTSAKTGRGVAELLSTIDRVREAFFMRVSTGELNRVLGRPLRDKAPLTTSGRALKIYYTAQTGVEPPTFTCFVNDPKLLHFSYVRYLDNTLRSHFSFQGTPIRIEFRDRGKD